MDLGLSADQLAVRSSIAELFAKEATSDRVRAAEPLGFDRALWALVCDLGLPAMGVGEQLGGAGMSCLDHVLVLEQLGRSLAPIPLVEATCALALLAGTRAADRVPAIIDERLVPTLALAAIRDGVAQWVPAGAVADVVVGLSGQELLFCSRESMPVDEPVANLGSSPLGHVTFEPLTTTIVEAGPEAMALHSRALEHWRVLMAAALVGIGAKSLELALDYVKERHAFGVTIAHFQAIQHRLADVAAQIDGARLLVYEAAWARETHRPDAGAISRMAFLFAADRAFHAASESLQFHGGYGYSLEYDIQLYFRRAKAWPLAIGAIPGEYRDLCRALVQLPTGA